MLLATTANFKINPQSKPFYFCISIFLNRTQYCFDILSCCIQFNMKLAFTASEQIDVRVPRNEEYNFVILVVSFVS